MHLAGNDCIAASNARFTSRYDALPINTIAARSDFFLRGTMVYLLYAKRRLRRLDAVKKCTEKA